MGKIFRKCRQNRIRSEQPHQHHTLRMIHLSFQLFNNPDTPTSEKNSGNTTLHETRLRKYLALQVP